MRVVANTLIEIDDEDLRIYIYDGFVEISCVKIKYEEIDSIIKALTKAKEIIDARH